MRSYVFREQLKCYRLEREDRCFFAWLLLRKHVCHYVYCWSLVMNRLLVSIKPYDSHFQCPARSYTVRDRCNSFSPKVTSWHYTLHQRSMQEPENEKKKKTNDPRGARTAIFSRTFTNTELSYYAVSLYLSILLYNYDTTNVWRRESYSYRQVNSFIIRLKWETDAHWPVRPKNVRINLYGGHYSSFHLDEKLQMLAYENNTILNWQENWFIVRTGREELGTTEIKGWENLIENFDETQ